VGLVAQLLSICGLNIFLLLHVSSGWLQDCTSSRSINVVAEETGGMTDLRSTQRSHWTQLYSSLLLILQHCAVLRPNGVAINWLQCSRSICYLSDQCSRTSFTVVTGDQSSRSLCNICMYVPTAQCIFAAGSSLHYSSLVSLLTLILLMWRIWWAHNNASKWQNGFNSAFTGLRLLHSITVRCIIVCSGSRTGKEIVCHLLVWCENVNQNWSYRDSIFVTK